MESLLKQNVFFLACSKRPKEALEKKKHFEKRACNEKRD
jgi:hypothetical protein